MDPSRRMQRGGRSRLRMPMNGADGVQGLAMAMSAIRALLMGGFAVVNRPEGETILQHMGLSR